MDSLLMILEMHQVVAEGLVFLVGDTGISRINGS
jgi:hypothetical protein